MFGILPLRAMYVSVVMIMLSMNCVFVQLCFLPLCLSKSTRYVYFNVSAFVYEQIANMLVALTAALSPVEVLMYGDEIPAGENAIVISNHFGAEWLIFHWIARKYEMVHGLRFIQKNSLKVIPVNWVCYMHDHFFIHRGRGEAARENTRTQLMDKMQLFVANKTPAWVLLFPEGTWIAGTKEQHVVDRSHRFCEKDGREPLQCVLAPRVGAYEALISAVRDSPSYKLYDCTLAFSEPQQPVKLGLKDPPSTYAYLNAIGDAFPDTPKKVHVHVQRLSADNHAAGEAAAKEFLWESAERKEKLLLEFEKRGAFDAPRRGTAAQQRLPALWLSCLAGHASVVLQLWVFAQFSSRSMLAYVGFCSFLAIMAAWMIMADSPGVDTIDAVVSLPVAKKQE